MSGWEAGAESLSWIIYKGDLAAYFLNAFKNLTLTMYFWGT